MESGFCVCVHTNPRKSYPKMTFAGAYSHNLVDDFHYFITRMCVCGGTAYCGNMYK